MRNATAERRTQPFPQSGVLFKNLNLSKSALTKQIGRPREAAYSYIVRTVGITKSQSPCFEQFGSAPNFQGGVISLCTCKHQMRSTRDASQWKGTWIVGFTSRCRHQKKHWLFYLARISKAHESHADLWYDLPVTVRDAKAAHRDYFGDLFKPLGRLADEDQFNPHCYVSPTHHVHQKSSCSEREWHNDINYRHIDRYGKPSLLVGDPKLTFIWKKPVLFFDDKHCRNFKKWQSIAELLTHLKSKE